LRPTRLAEHRTHISGRRDELKGKLEAILAAKGALVWEVGSGHGHFLTAYSKANPEQICVGVDIMSDRVVRAHRKKERAKLSQLHFIRADAEDFLAVMPEDIRFTTVFVLFPDPWPKRRHHKNRIMNARFLSSVAEHSSRETRLYFRTDHEDYFDGASVVLKGHADWIVEPDAQLPFEEETVFQKRSKGHFTLVARRR
jgi:tRNA (guanine-N7-)-methyltransferase